jgi:putative membrane protein
MTLRWILATLHLLALGFGLGAAYARSRALKGKLDDAGLSRVFLADTWWGIAGLLWIVTGVIRAFFGVEKGTAYYMGTGLFHAKLGLVVVILALEVLPMTTLIRWRSQRKRGETPDTSKARALAAISHAQAGIAVIIVLLATAIARGMWR